MNLTIQYRGQDAPAESVAASARNLAHLFALRRDASTSRVAAWEKREGVWRAWTWSELFDDAAAVARGLAEIGVDVGDRVAILGPTSYEWSRLDLGGHLAGAVTIGVYPRQAPEQVRYLLEHSRARVVFVADAEELETVLEAARGLDTVESIVPWEPSLVARFVDRDARVVAPDRFRATPATAAELAQRRERVRGDDTAILVYTSGTTGPPKAARISHDNILAVLRAQRAIFDFRRDDLLFSFLPMAHVTERVLAFYMRIGSGVAAAYASSIGAVLGEIVEARPTVFGSVPRIFEKAYAKIRGDVARKPWLARAIFGWAERVGRERLPYVLAEDPVPSGLARRYAVADRLVFAKIRAAFGGRVRAFITGAAPISIDILEFFWAAGLPVYEAYGMTEATVLTHVNRPGSVRLGTVGRTVLPMETRIAEDGEVLLRGPFVFQGYLGDEAATAETIQHGWLHSGDIGHLDADGFLRVTDRKKHLIITAGGKNVAPANIERAIKSQSPLISQVHAHGDRRPYICALIAPSPLETLEWGAARGVLEAAEAETLRRELAEDPSARSARLAAAMARVVGDPRFRELFSEPVRAGNRSLARVERVRRFVILDRDFGQEYGELTPTMKLKRKAIEQLHAATFDRVYEDPSFAVDAERGDGDVTGS